MEASEAFRSYVRRQVAYKDCDAAINIIQAARH